MQKRWKRWIRAWLFLMVFAIGSFLIVVVMHPVYTASIEGLSESIELQTFTQNQEWRLDHFEIEPCIADGPEPKPTPVKDQVFTIKPGARVRIEKLEDGATVRIEVSALKESEAGGPRSADDCKTPSLVDAVDAKNDVTRLMGSRVRFERVFKSSADQTWLEPAVVLPVHGTLIPGEEIGNGVETMLTSGTVTMHADQSERSYSWIIRIFRKITYVGESVLLSRGDRVLPTDAQTEQLTRLMMGHRSPTSAPDPAANGYVRITAKGPLQFGIIEPANLVKIQRAGIAMVEVEMSFWQRVQNEPALTTLIAFMVALIALVELREAFAVPFEKWHER